MTVAEARAEGVRLAVGGERVPRPNAPSARRSCASSDASTRVPGASPNRLQRPRPCPGLPVLEFRGTRPRPEAGPQRQRGRRAIRHRARGDDRSRGGGAQLRPSEQAGPAARYGFREALDYTARRLPEGESVADCQQLHGPPPRHDAGRARQRAPRRVMVERFHADRLVEATELLLQERMPRNVARRPQPRADEVKGRRRARLRAAVRAPIQLASRRDPPHAPAVERPLRGDGDGRRLGLQPLARHRRDALARRRDPRLVGQLSLPARHPERRRVVGRATSPAASSADSYEVTYSEDRVEISGVTDRSRPRSTIVVSAEDDAEIRRVDAHQPRIPAPRDRADVVRRDRARAARPPTSPTRPSRTCSCRPSSSPSSARCSRPAGRDRATSADLGCPRRGGRGRGRGAIQYETDRARFLGRGRGGPLPRLGDRRAAAVEHGRAVLDPIVSLRLPRRARAGRDRATRSSPPSSRRRGTRALDLADKYREPAHVRAGRRRSPGRRPRCSSITSASTPTRRISSSASPTGSCTRTHRCGRRRRALARNRAARPGCGPTASPATCRSCWCASTRPRTSTSSGSSCAPTSTGA